MLSLKEVVFPIAIGSRYWYCVLVLVASMVPSLVQSETASGWVMYQGSPLNAMVIANGQSMFSSSSDGRYDLVVPLDNQGQIAVHAFASGFAPHVQTLSPSQAMDLTINMDRSASTKVPVVTRNLAAGSQSGRVLISGTVTHAGVGICTLALANGQSMFTCGNNLGLYSLDVPIGSSSDITAFTFAEGFQPYQKVIGPLTAAVEGISGIYQGSYSGSASGTWVIYISEPGHIAGAITTSSGDYLGVTGSVQNSGTVSFDVNGVVASTVTYTGTIDPATGRFSCTWQDSTARNSGDCIGSKLSPQSDGPRLDLLEYFLLSKGSNWLYDVKNQGASVWEWRARAVMENYETINGVRAIQRVYYDSDYANMELPDDYDLFSSDDNYLYMHGSNQVGDPDWNDDPLGLSVFNPPLTFKRWLKEYETTRSLSTGIDPNATEENVSISISLLGFEDVSVAAGTFTACAKLLMVFEDANGISANMEWMANGIGSVRTADLSDSGETDIAELNQYHIAPGVSD